MIPETGNEPSWIPAVAVAVAVVALGGALYLNRPLESQRPTNPSTVLEAPRYRWFPLARLWQDPLHVVYEHWNNVDEPQSVPFVTDIRDVTTGAAGSHREADDDDQPILRLLVMLSGMPYSNDREQRRRQRHAVVSALTDAGFVPSDGTRLRYFRAPPFQTVSHATNGEQANATTTGERANYTTLVGYETYEPDVEPVWGHWASIEVFWLNTEDFLQHPLHKVSALIAALPSGAATTVLLGPPSSGVLKEMLEEDPNEMPRVVQGFLKKVAQFKKQDFESFESSARMARDALRVFSHHATIPAKWLVCRPDPECPAVTGRLSQKLGVQSFHSAIADDGQVMETVLDELVNRHACIPTRKRPTVVIVSEQDTVYGRMIGDLAEHAAERVHIRAGCKIQIVEHGYLQGVDGEMPPAEDRTRRDEPAQGDADAAGGARVIPSLLGGGFEQPFGAARLDYVRRLSERLRDISDATLVAIGVVGYDLYDKLLVLQALRESHPGVVFFTTDMDARLLDPAVNRWTRNLIVGSAYGLSPPEPASDTFRDSYQVALFLAVQEALGHRHRVAHEPMLFEISRTSFFTLGSQVPERSWKQVAVLLTPLAGLAIFAYVMLQRLQRDKTARMRCRRYIFVMILAVAAAACLYAFVQGIPNKEPGSLFEGINTVPMVMLQITTIVFAIAIICFANGRMRQALSRIADRMGEEEPKYGKQALCTALREWRSELRKAVLNLIWNQDIAGGDVGSKTDPWCTVLRYRGWWPRFVRISAGVIVGLALRCVFFSNVRDNQPLLGQAVTTPDWVVYVLPVVLFWAIFYCCDTVGTWRRFILAVGRFEVNRRRTERMTNDVAARGRQSMDLLVYCTELVGPVVVLPLILMALLMFARSTLFEGWNWTIQLIVFHIALGVYILSVAIAFQRATSRARDAVLDRLQEAKIDNADEVASAEIESVIKYVQARRFVPWTHHPILQTLTLPLGSVVLITLLEMWIGR